MKIKVLLSIRTLSAASQFRFHCVGHLQDESTMIYKHASTPPPTTVTAAVVPTYTIYDIKYRNLESYENLHLLR